MSVVGAFPGFNQLHRQTVRAPINPMDRSTVVSIYPKDIKEVKPTTQPCVYELAKGSIENPSLLVVGPASWWKELDEQQPLLEIINGSVQVAEAIVRDYCQGLFCCNMHDAMPGIFWIPGEINVLTLKSKYAAELKKAEQKQLNYYKALVMEADSLWARTNGNSIVISNDMRMAANFLNLVDKPWTIDFQTMEKVNCKACGTLLNPKFPVCPHCKAIWDEAKAKELNIKFAQ